MIINIGGRGTGKTSRMLRDMIDKSIKENRKAILLVHNRQEVNRIESLLKAISEVYPEAKEVLVMSYEQYQNTFKKGQVLDEVNLYVDNLDYFANMMLGKDIYMITMSSDEFNVINKNEED